MSKKLIIFLTAVFTLTFAMLAFCYLYMDGQTMLQISSEQGPIEALHGDIFLIAAVLGAIAWFRKRTTLWVVYIFLMLAAAARELDWHKEFTQDSIFKIKFYTESNAPLVEKTGGLIFVFLLLASLIYLIIKLFKNRHQIRLSNSPFILSILGLGSLVAAKTIDSLTRWLPPLKEFVFANAGMFRLCEETLETTGAVLFAACAIAAIYRK